MNYRGLVNSNDCNATDFPPPRCSLSCATKLSQSKVNSIELSISSSNVEETDHGKGDKETQTTRSRRGLRRLGTLPAAQGIMLHFRGDPCTSQRTWKRSRRNSLRRTLGDPSPQTECPLYNFQHTSSLPPHHTPQQRACGAACAASRFPSF